MKTCEEIEGEAGFAIGEEVPSETVQHVAFDAGDADALPA
jgi:hypothetical protein